MEHEPDWDHWNAFESLEVWQAVALSVGRDPSTVIDNRKRLVNSWQDVALFEAGPDFAQKDGNSSERVRREQSAIHGTE